MAWCHAGLFRNIVLSVLVALAFMASGIQLTAQSKTGTASLAVQVAPAVQVTTDGTNASVWIRLGTGGNGSLWGDSTSTCTSPISGATTITSSGKFTYALSVVPFLTSNAFICAYDPGPPILSSNVTWPHTAASLAFSQQPTNAASGASLTPAVTVKVLDSNGVLLTSSTASVSIAISSGTGTTGATLSGTLTQSAINGVATFNNLSIDKGGTGYTLKATSGTLTSATSNTFNITSGTATKLVYAQQPTTTTAGSAINPAVTVQVQDASGNVVTTDSSTVSIAISSGGVLSGGSTLSVAAVNGVATFSNLVPTKSGSYTLSATDGSLTAATSSNFTVNPAALDHFLVEKSGGGTIGTQTAGTAFSLRITAQDVNNNTVTSFTSTASLTSTGALTGSPVTSGAFTAGVLDPQSVTITNTGSFTTTATASSKTGTSAAFTVNAGVANKLAITSVNGGSNPTAGTGFSVVVQAQDANGNPANVVATTGLTLSLNTGTGILGGTLTGTITAGSNSTTISGVTYTKAQSGVILTATRTSGDSLTAGNSAAFTVNAGTATKVLFTTQPGGGTGGTSWTTQPTVTVEDGNGNTVTGSSASIQLAIGTNPGGGTLTCAANPQNATSGLDSFAGCNINKIGTGYTLTATSSGLISATSGTFNITLGAAAQLAFTVQPSTSTVATNAFTAQPTVTVQDAGGNTVTTSTASITLTITSGTGATGAGLTCTANPKNASSGVDAFAGCKIDTGSNSTYTLTATSGGLSSAVSNPFTIQDFSLAVTTAISPNPTSHKSALATATITLTSIGSFTGSVAVSCTASGPSSGCTSPVTVPANGSVPTTLTLSTNGNSTGAGTYTITVTGTFGTLSRSVSPSPTWTLN